MAHIIQSLTGSLATDPDQNVERWVAGDDKVISVSVPGVDLASASFRYGIFDWSTPYPAEQATALVDAASITVDGSTISIPVDGLETEFLPAGRYYHELEMVAADGAVSTLFVGKINLLLHRLRSAVGLVTWGGQPATWDNQPLSWSLQ